jgi:hypothetical protein
MSEKQDNALKEARAALRKILASKGRLQGNFYYAGNTKGTEGALIVTLTARDPKGSKAANAGKEIRKEIKGAKFVRGTVTAEGSKLYFTPSSGTGTKDHMKLGFKKTLCNADGFSFIKKALFRTPDGKEDDAPSSESESTAPTTPETPESLDTDINFDDLFDDGMTAEQRAEEAAAIEQLVTDQTALGDLNALLADFLSDESASKELGEQIAYQLDQISQLEKTDGTTPEQLEEQRRALAAALYTGEDPFPGPGEEVSAEMKQVLALSMGKASKSLGLFLSDAAEKIKKIHTEVVKQDETWREERAPELLKDLDDYRKAVHSYHDQLQKTLGTERRAQT